MAEVEGGQVAEVQDERNLAYPEPAVDPEEEPGGDEDVVDYEVRTDVCGSVDEVFVAGVEEIDVADLEE